MQYRPSVYQSILVSIHSQDKFSPFLSLVARLERLRAATGQTWEAIGADLGIKRAMVFHVLSGRRSFSEKTLRLLLQCEVKAGLRSQASLLIEQGFRANDVVSMLLESERSGPDVVGIKDIDGGFKSVTLCYRRGLPPKGYPTTIKVIAPKNTVLWRTLGQKGASEKSSKFLEACLPALQDKPDLLDRLTPTNFSAIFETALSLTFGINWRDGL
jgi:hypothetical protein